MYGSILCGSRQARVGDLEAAAREGTTRGPTAITLDACLPGRARRVPIFPWRQLAQSRKLDAGYAQLECCARSSTQESKEDRF